MGDIKTIFTNLFLAYSLGSKDQFVDAISKYSDEHELDDQGIKELIDQIFFEISLLKRKRDANELENVLEIEEKVQEKRAQKTPSDPKEDTKIDLLIAEIKSLKSEITTIKSQLNKK